MAIPIWKDTFFEVPATASPFTYSIEINDGETIFNGKAWAAPQEAVIKVGVNRVAQDYLHMDFPDILSMDRIVTGVTSFNHDDAIKTFVIYDEDHNVVESFDFRLDWSYKDRPSDSNQYLSEPINLHGTHGMFYFSTIYNQNLVFTRVSYHPEVLWIDDYYNVYDPHYCGDGALYFLNRNCGWSSFLIEGNILRRDDYTRYSMNRAYDNTTLQFGKMTYNNHITPTWELHTGFLRNDESKRLAFHLLSSNQVYFHDLKEDRIYPVVVTDASGEYKTVKNQGNKLVTYTINITASQAQHNIG
jgi:hypothetical protein